MNINFFKKITLPKIAKQHPFAFWVAIVLHVGLVVGLLFSNVQRWEIPKHTAKSSVMTKAVIVDLTEFKKSCNLPNERIFFEESEAFLSENDLSFPVAKELFSIKPAEAFSEILNSIPTTTRNWVFVNQYIYEEVSQRVRDLTKTKKGPSVSKD